MKKTYAIINLSVIIGVIIWNYVANSTGINNNTVGSLSDEYYNLFTPADYAFSIWGLIFIGLFAHGIFQVKRAFDDQRDDEFILKIGPWLTIANLANGAWIWLWLMEYTGLSVIIMLILLISLLVIILKLNMERWDAPFPIIAGIWWPLCLYSGWITVATIANISAYLAKINWSAVFTEVTWTVIMIIIAALINLLMILLRNMREFALVGVWALIAIAVRHWNEIPVIQWTALLCTGILLVAAGIQAYQNRETNPVMRLIQGEGKSI